jgi:TPR repeat protein
MPLRMKISPFALLFIAFQALAVEPDSAGLETLRQAAERGDVDAQYELGILYEFGYNFTDHNAAAYAWYSRAAEQGSALASKRRDILKSQLSADEVARAQTLIKTKVAAPAPAPTAPSTEQH